MLIIGNVLLIIAAVILIVLLTAPVPVDGLWYSEAESNILAFSDNDKMNLYEIEIMTTGRYEYNRGNGEFTVLDEDYDFEVDGDVMIVDKTNKYYRVIDDDFDISLFLVDNAEIISVDDDMPDNSITPEQTQVIATPILEDTPILTLKPAITLMPTATAMSTPEPTATAISTPEPTATAISTPEPTATAALTPKPETIQEQNDKILAQQLVQNIWYGVFKQENDKTPLYKYKEDADEYVFYVDGTLMYQYAYSKDILYGTWEVLDGQLSVIYDNSAIGKVIWDMEMEFEGNSIYMYLYSKNPNQENVFWVYSDTPLER